MHNNYSNDAFTQKTEQWSLIPNALISHFASSSSSTRDFLHREDAGEEFFRLRPRRCIDCLFLLFDLIVSRVVLSLLCSNNDNFLWLPQEYRSRCSAFHGNTLAIGQISGQVCFIEIDNVDPGEGKYPTQRNTIKVL
jgi:hypothetical protein